jgi:hypothetical protein
MAVHTLRLPHYRRRVKGFDAIFNAKITPAAGCIHVGLWPYNIHILMLGNILYNNTSFRFFEKISRDAPLEFCERLRFFRRRAHNTCLM